jgi:hypothetical protein
MEGSWSDKMYASITVTQGKTTEKETDSHNILLLQTHYVLAYILSPLQEIRGHERRDVDLLLGRLEGHLFRGRWC